MGRLAREVRFPIWGSLCVAVPVFLLVFSMTAFSLTMVVWMLLGPRLSSELLGLGIVLGTCGGAIGLGFIIARDVYTSCRWRLVEDGTPYCHNCDYNLTGNESGICPECGEPITTEE